MSTTRWRTPRPTVVAASALAAVTVLSVSIVACGGDDDGSTASTGEPLASASTVAPSGSRPPSGSTDATAGEGTAQEGTDQEGTGQEGTGQEGTATDSSVAGVLPDGFTTVTAVITDADGAVCEVCLWLADTGAERAQGLMGVTDLGDAAGMLFRFDDVTQSSFYMFQTPTPLSIAWFGDDGAWVGTAEMEPCLDTPAGDCPLYAPEAPYRFALEAFAGGLEPLGVGPGSTLEVVAGSESPTCDLVG